MKETAILYVYCHGTEMLDRVHCGRYAWYLAHIRSLHPHDDRVKINLHEAASKHTSKCVSFPCLSALGGDLSLYNPHTDMG